MLTLQELQERMGRLSEWALEDKFIVKEVHFESFKESMEYVNKVAEIAEKMHHHPEIMIMGNIVRLSLTTHKEHELTNKDFDVAEEIDKIKLNQ